MSRIKIILLVVLLVFILIQFIRPVRDENGQASPDQIGKVYAVPENVNAVLRASCYDCHSNNTDYPWYAEIQPAGWWLASHIRRGKSELNFDRFGEYSKRRQDSKLKSIANSIEDGTMPLPSYAFIHTDAKLSKKNKMLIKNWIKATRDSLSKKK
ncbi:cytochrome C [Pelobium manganitolerans]|uniref:Cytochrome C n=1 Tax=Pelobium manganitolerans TaxID=1842495 RepID=A0A419S4U1_9SPHI|nr:heme-binding domain-containing protein [Pelobium manganitolerans]RKD15125.1 cytochrome C [Pelobium manganitolerans]